MKKLGLLIFILCTCTIYAQSEVVKLPKFPSYITKTIDTLNYYKNGGTLKGNVREVTKYLKSYRATSKYFNQKKELISAFGKKLHTIKNKNKSVKEIYFLDTNKSKILLHAKSYYNLHPYKTKNFVDLALFIFFVT